MKAKSCVFKKDWRFYKTCYECGMMRKCSREDKPKWYGRIIEAVAVGFYRWRIRRKMRRMFRGMTRKEVKNARYNIRRLNKQL